MKTRFDNGDVWINGQGEILQLQNLETDYLMNIVKMLISKPTTVISILISDIETHKDYVWSFSATNSYVKESINNVTKMSVEEIQSYVENTPLFNGICKELVSRGVDVNNYITIIKM